MFSLSIVNACPERIKNHNSSFTWKVMHLAFVHLEWRNTEHIYVIHTTTKVF